MRLDDVFDDAQTNSHALCLASQFRARPVEPLKDLLLLLQRNTAAVVFDEQPKAWRVFRANTCPLPSALRPPPSALRPLPSALRPLPSVLRPLSSVLCPPSSVLCPPSSVRVGKKRKARRKKLKS